MNAFFSSSNFNPKMSSLLSLRNSAMRRSYESQHFWCIIDSEIRLQKFFGFIRMDDVTAYNVGGEEIQSENNKKLVDDKR